MTSIDIAVEGTDAAIVAGLLNAGADPNGLLHPHSYKSKQSALYRACFPGHAAISAELCEGNVTTLADLEARTAEGRTPQQEAPLHNAADVIEVLLKAGADTAAQGGGQTALHIAAMKKHIKCVLELFDGGALISARTTAARSADDIGGTAVDFASRAQSTKKLELFQAAAAAAYKSPLNKRRVRR